MAWIYILDGGDDVDVGGDLDFDVDVGGDLDNVVDAAAVAAADDYFLWWWRWCGGVDDDTATNHDFIWFCFWQSYSDESK